MAAFAIRTSTSHGKWGFQLPKATGCKSSVTLDKLLQNGASLQQVNWLHEEKALGKGKKRKPKKLGLLKCKLFDIENLACSCTNQNNAMLAQNWSSFIRQNKGT